jgi:O-antigen/teichoic acid export membrane protein
MTDVALGRLARLQRLILHQGGKVDALLSFGVRFGGALATFLSQLLIARWMGLVEFGTFSNAWVWVTLVGTLVQLGMASSTTRFAAAALERGDRAGVKGIVIFSQLAVLATSILATLLVALVASLPAIGFSPGQREALLVGCLCIPLFALVDIGKGIARADGPAWLAYLPGFLLRPILFLAVLAVFQLIGLSIDAQTAVWAMLVALALTWILQWAVIRHYLGPALKGPARFDGRAWFGGSIAIVVVDGYFMLVTSLDVILVNAMIGPEAGGAYYAASRLASLVSYVMFAISAISSAQMARHYAAGRHQELAALVRKFVHWTFWPTLGAALLLAVSGPFLLDLFGAGFDSAAPALTIMLVGLVVQAAAGPTKFLLLMTGAQNGLALVLGLGAVLALVLDLTLIALWGAMGAAIGTTATIVVATGAMVWLARQRLGLWSVIGAR